MTMKQTIRSGQRSSPVASKVSQKATRGTKDNLPAEKSNVTDRCNQSGGKPIGDLESTAVAKVPAVVSPAGKSDVKPLQEVDTPPAGAKVPVVISPAGISHQSDGKDSPSTEARLPAVVFKKPDPVQDVLSPPPKSPTAEPKSEKSAKSVTAQPQFAGRHSSASTVSMTPSCLDELIADFCRDPPKKLQFERKPRPQTVKELFDARTSINSIQLQYGRELLQNDTPDDIVGAGSSPDITSVTEVESCLTLTNSSRVSLSANSVLVPDSMIVTMSPSLDTSNVAVKEETHSEDIVAFGDGEEDSNGEKDGEQEESHRRTTQIFLSDEENRFKAARSVKLSWFTMSLKIGCCLQ